MRTRALLALFGLLASTTLHGCGPATTTIDVSGTASAAQSAAAPTETLVPSATPTPYVVVITATPTPRPAATDTSPPPTATGTAAPSPTSIPGSPGADLVVAFNPGPGVEAPYADPQALLGQADLDPNACCQGAVQLGRAGSVLLAFTDNRVVDGDGPDFQIYGEAAGDDFLLVEVSADGQAWAAYPKLSESPGGLDLADVGLAEVLYVRLTDLQPATPTGAEVDAVVALHSGPGLEDTLSPLPDALARAGLTLYEGPSSRMKAVGQVPAGSALTVLGRSQVSGWAKVESTDGASGWCPVSELGLNVSLAARELAQSPPTPTTAPRAARLAFVSGRDGGWNVYVMNADGSGLRRLTYSSWNCSNPSWSPDGREIVYSAVGLDNPDLYSIYADGSYEDYLEANETDELSPAWAPDGKRIAFVSSRHGNYEIYVWKLWDTVIRLTNDPASDDHPAWSPDGRRIAFSSNRDGNSEIYVMNAEGGGVVRLSRNPPPPTATPGHTGPGTPLPRALPPRSLYWGDREPTWSPDGRRIAFASDRDGNYEIYLVNADGSGGLTRLTNHPAEDRSPAWSPDGKRIAFVSNRDGNYEIYLVGPSGEGLVRLTNHPGDDMDPAWSPQ